MSIITPSVAFGVSSYTNYTFAKQIDQNLESRIFLDNQLICHDNETFTFIPKSPAYVFGERVIRPLLDLCVEQSQGVYEWLKRKGKYVDQTVSKIFSLFPSAYAEQTFIISHGVTGQEEDWGVLEEDGYNLKEEDSIAEIHQQLNCEEVSKDKIKNWLVQFEPQDRPTALALLEKIDYFCYQRLKTGLKIIHESFVSELRKEGFINTSGKEYLFENVHFSRAYTAKSGDLISYIYRTANKIRSVCFKNIANLELDESDKSNKALVLLEDYVGTGSQFLFSVYARDHYQLFNQYRKIYLVTVVANEVALERFQEIKEGNYTSLFQHGVSVIKPATEADRQAIYERVRRIDPQKIELIFLHREMPLSKLKNTESITALIQKYTTERYWGGQFTMGHTTFFHNSPNNLPEILWSSQLTRLDGSPWIPLFERVEDISVYGMAHRVPVEEHVH